MQWWADDSARRGLPCSGRLMTLEGGLPCSGRLMTLEGGSFHAVVG